MEELMNKFNDIFIAAGESQCNLNVQFLKYEKCLEDFRLKCVQGSTPKQKVKRAKRFASIEEDELPKASNDANETRLQDATMSVVNESIIRPSRTAKDRANLHLKEVGLGTKMRNDHGEAVIKIERPSILLPNIENNLNVTNLMKSNNSSDEGFSSTNTNGKGKIRNTSIEIIADPIENIDLSEDDNDTNIMPPPKLPAPKRKVRTKQIKQENLDESASLATSSASSSLSSAENEPVKRSTRTKQKELEKEKDKKKENEKAQKVQKEADKEEKRNKSVKAKKKDEKSNKVSSTEDLSKTKIKTERISHENPNNKERTEESGAEPKIPSPAKSENSIYEDAINESHKLVVVVAKMSQALVRQMMPSTTNQLEVEVKNRTLVVNRNETFLAAPSIQDGTFAIAKKDSNSQFPLDANGTFAVKSPSDISNATFAIPSTPENSDEIPNSTPCLQDTFVVEVNTNPSAVNSSIMTEDNSNIEEADIPDTPSPQPPPPPPAKQHAAMKMKKNELFNPCLQSPIKSKIEAFEKAAKNSPIVTRNYGKGATPSLRSAKIPSSTSTTPLASTLRLRKQVSTTVTPTAQTLPKSSATGSATKAASFIPKKNTGAIPKAQSSSREHSAERLASSNVLAEEKKKKREEKQRLAQQQREQLEKERKEQAERLLREKEEKHKKMLLEKEEKIKAEAIKKAKKMEEFEKRRHLEEVNQRFLLEQKREELARVEQQQKNDRDNNPDVLKLAQAKEHHEIKLHKQLIQQKMQQQIQQKQQQLQKEQQKIKTNEYTFEMIQTDDSTDDESDKGKKSKRPPPPQWCSREEKRSAIDMQSHVNLNVIDAFFSVSPMSPDLREIFPKIEPRKLKRNSSAIWRTPPRYSQMPKY